MARNGVEVLVIGGGITGAGIVRDAAMRGLDAGLLERGDFASGTSSRSSKLIHGGVRYLEQGDVALVMEAAQERRTLGRIASHLAAPARMAMPVHGKATMGVSPGLMKLRAGLWAFEKMAPVEDEKHEILSAEETLARIPILEPEKLQGAALFTEYVTDDARLTLETIKSAHRYGARIANHAPAIRMEPAPARSANGSSPGASDRRGFRVLVRDELSGRELAIDARVVVNAAGPWVDAVRAIGGARDARMHLTKGIHLVVPLDVLPVRDMVVMKAIDRRPVFVVPFADYAWIGTTDTNYPEPAERPTITREDVDYLLEATNRTFSRAHVDAGDVIGAWAGVRPLVHQEGKKPSEISRRDEILVEPSGLVSIAGGKLTTYRRMAERVVDKVIGLLDLTSAADCRTAEVPLVEDGAPIAMSRTRLSAGEIAQAIEHECALSVYDVLERRARCNLFARGNGLDLVDGVVEQLARGLGWNEERCAREANGYRARIAEDMAWREDAAGRSEHA